jgi:hypothetical protein
MFWGTVSLQFLPWSVLAARIIQSGQLPLWNPLVGLGAPLLANYQSGLIYPPNWLVLLSASLWGAGWAAWVQTWLVTLHIIWAGLGMFFLARMIGIRPLGQVVCGLAFALSGYLVSRSAFISINAAVSWVPWFLLTVTWLAKGRLALIKVIIVGMVTCMLLLTGHAQTAWYTILFSGAWITLIAWQDSNQQPSAQEALPTSSIGFKVRYVSLRLLLFVISLGLGACLAAVQLIPTAELLLQSQRAKAVEFDYAMTYSFWPWRFLTLLAPGFFGSPVSGNYWGYGNYWEDALYIGVLPLLLVTIMFVGTLVRYLRHGNKESRQQAPAAQSNQKAIVFFLLGTIFVSFILALGKNTPIFPWLYLNIPTFATFQAPTRFSIWAVISLTLLAGMGIDRLRRPKGRTLYWTRLGTAGAGAITLGAGLAWYFLGDISPSFISSTALLGLFALCTGILILFTPNEQDCGDKAGVKRIIWEWALLLVLGLDLLLASWNLNPGIDKDFFTKVASSASSLRTMLDGGRLHLNLRDEYELKFGRFMRFDTYQINEDWKNLREVLLPNLNILDTIPSTNNFDPLVSARYARWMDALAKIEKAGAGTMYFRLLNLMGVRAVEYLNHDNTSGVGFQPVENSDRFRWVPCAVPVHDGDEAWDLVFNGKTDIEGEVIIERGEDSPVFKCAHGEKSARTTIIDDQPNRIEIRVSSQEMGWLVISDLWYPGWRVEIDGQRAPVLRANYLFRAVQIPAGEHTIAWIYSPGSFWIGLLISVTAWILVGIMGLLYMTRRWKNR